MACYGGLKGILTGLTKSADHPSSGPCHSRPSSQEEELRKLQEARSAEQRSAGRRLGPQKSTVNRDLVQ